MSDLNKETKRDESIHRAAPAGFNEGVARDKAQIDQIKVISSSTDLDSFINNLQTSEGRKANEVALEGIKE